MKNVLFATTALVAFAGAASAASHASGATVSFSGEITAGYNDETEGGLFYDTELNLTASVDFGDNVTAKLTYELVSTADNVEAGTDIDPTVEINYTGGSLTASLKYGDLGDKGASEYFYADRDGMGQDVENHDSDRDVRALVEFGNFGVAAGCQIVGSGDCGGVNVGLGATFGSIKLGVGYDDNSSGQTAVTAVSADATFGSINVGVSYADGAEQSVGVEVGTTFGAIEVGAYYANNSVSDDGYGVSVDYTAGALTVGVFYDNVDDGGAGTGRAEYGVDVAYTVNSQITARAGYLEGEAEVLNAAFTGTDTVGSYFYVGMEYAVNDNISATVSYAEANEFGAPEYKQGISAFITASF
ncbi:MAG: porin [Rhodobacteraceae bacterium]|nr:porin [Paracoccaceae bacterium]